MKWTTRKARHKKRLEENAMTTAERKDLFLGYWSAFEQILARMENTGGTLPVREEWIEEFQKRHGGTMQQLRRWASSERRKN